MERDKLPTPDNAGRWWCSMCGASWTLSTVHMVVNLPACPHCNAPATHLRGMLRPLLLSADYRGERPRA